MGGEQRAEVRDGSALAIDVPGFEAPALGDSEDGVEGLAGRGGSGGGRPAGVVWGVDLPRGPLAGVCAAEGASGGLYV